MGIQVCSNEEPRPFPKGNSNEIEKSTLTKSNEPQDQFQPNLPKSSLSLVKGMQLC